MKSGRKSMRIRSIGKLNEGRFDENKDVMKGGPPEQAVCRPIGGCSRKDL